MFGGIIPIAGGMKAAILGPSAARRQLVTKPPFLAFFKDLGWGGGDVNVNFGVGWVIYIYFYIYFEKYI